MKYATPVAVAALLCATAPILALAPTESALAAAPRETGEPRAIEPRAAGGTRDGGVAAPTGETIPNQFIVTLRGATDSAGVAGAATTVAEAAGARMGFVYSRALKGFSVQATPAQAARIARDPRVLAVHPDGIAKRTGDVTPGHDPRVASGEATRRPTGEIDESGAAATSAAAQRTRSWGIDRIDQRGLPLDSEYHFNVTAPTVHVYMIDTGVRPTHSEFEGRASVGVDLVGDGRAGLDCSGHGTHVAGTIGGKTFGVAKRTSLVAVRVFSDCDGTQQGAPWSRVIAGIDWITAHAVRPAVVNMSLGGNWYWPVDQAVHRSIETGLTFVVAGGNDGVDACSVSPGDTLSAITIGATDASDSRPSFSNWGSCLDLFAPGDNITSAFHTSDTATSVGKGTSMATPHVTGIVALYLWQYPSANPMTVRNAVVGMATSKVIANGGSESPNRLAFTYLRPETRMTFDASPEPVRRGGTVKLQGRLKKYGRGFADQAVELYFKPDGGRQALKGTVTTDETGNFLKSFTQDVAGTWTARYPSRGVIIGSSAADSVFLSEG